MTLGTVSYMSPEQVTADPLDGRSDIFSFGVVLYECATGHQPFKGKTSGLILSEILNRTPPPPLQFNPDLPLRLQEIITNCLEKDRELRYQDAGALRTDLKRLKRDLESGPRSASRLGIPIEGASSAAQPITVTLPAAAVPPSRRSRGLLAVAIAAVVVASTTAAFFVFRASMEQPKEAAVKAVDAVQPPPPTVPLAPAPSVVESKQEPVRSPQPVPTPRPAATAPHTVVETPPPAPAAATTAPAPVSTVAATPPPSTIAATPAPPPPPELPKSAPALPPAVAAAPLTSNPAAPVEDDEAVIRRVVAAYARAIEGKDLDAFKTVKPNLSAAEQRRLEDSFRAVASQKVDINVLSIERRGSSAAVKVRRRDTLTAGGRSQTSESQQTLTLIRSGAGWVISEIGR
jgi:hypothetical protein